VGRILDYKKGLVACGDGALKLLRVQPDGGKPMDFASFINGGYLTGDRGFS
jgi:methionyl-tRNA formyltransferase